MGVGVGIVIPGDGVKISIFLKEFGHFRAREANLVIPGES